MRSRRIEHRCEFVHRHGNEHEYHVYLICLGSFFNCIIRVQQAWEGDREHTLPERLWRILEPIVFHEEIIRAQVEDAIYQFYRELAPYDAIDYGDYMDTGELVQPIVAPRDISKEQIWTLMEHCHIDITDYENSPEQANFDICFVPSWDEHELVVPIRQWRVLSVVQY